MQQGDLIRFKLCPSHWHTVGSKRHDSYIGQKAGARPDNGWDQGGGPHREGKHLEDLKFCRDENKGSCGGLKGGLRIWRYEE